jgi:hypothetical protein
MWLKIDGGVWDVRPYLDHVMVVCTWRGRWMIADHWGREWWFEVER